MEPVRVALAGNPNSGKTTLFNAMTGARQHVGNWGGVTVEVKTGRARFSGRDLAVTDLPGTYSLSAQSPEERAARDFLVREPADVVINVIDSTNLERNLFLTLQIIETARPVVLAFNMTDELEKSGAAVDYAVLGDLLGTPIVPTVGRTGKGVRDLLSAVMDVAHGKTAARPVQIMYGLEIEEEIRALETALAASGMDSQDIPLRWWAIKLLENDAGITAMLPAKGNGLAGQAGKARARLEKLYGDDLNTVFTEQRYGFISGAIRETVTRKIQDRIGLSDKIDAVLTHPFLAYLIFGAFMWLLFYSTFRLGAYPAVWIEWLFDRAAALLAASLPESLLRGLLVDGVLGGVGSVAVFLPNILILFFGISIMEDTGYMARAAFIMDKIMHKMGLHGKSFIPMIMGLGCNVPAIMAARTLESRKDRVLTILVTPLITCSARLPIYVLFAGAFFAGHAGNVVFLMYGISFAAAFLVSLLFRKTLFRGPEHPFVMELPPYRVPTLRSVAIHMWEKAKHYIRRIGTIVLLFSIVLFFLSHYPKGPDGGIEHTAAGAVGRALEPAIAPAGFDWRMGVSLVTGFVAKEMVVGTMGVLYGTEEPAGRGNGALAQALRARYSALQALAFMIFALIYTPCLASLITLIREIRSTRWSLFAVIYPVVLAWLVAAAVYRVGTLLGFGN